MKPNISIFDTTLRDGAQTPGVHFGPDQKVAIAQALEAFGVATIEAGFPISSPQEAQAVQHVAKAISRSEVAALARCRPADVDAAARALEAAARPVVHVFLGTSDIHLRAKLRMTRAEAIRSIRTTVRHARRVADTVQFSAEDATRTERPFLRQCIETAVEAGAARINIPDTVGCALPWEYAQTIQEAVSWVGSRAVISAHCHNDMGLASANSVAAVRAGARQVEVAVNGIGERAGNASIEEVGVILAMKEIAGTGLDLSRITRLSAMIAEATGIPVQANRPIVGANAFRHASGIHQDGIIKQAACYEYVPPALIGASGHELVLGARSGRTAVAHKARAIGFDLDETAVGTVYDAVIQAADAGCGTVGEEQLAEIIQAAGIAPRKEASSGRAIPRPAASVDCLSL